jgi:hypothetical protein
VLKKTACFINPIWTPYVGIHIFYPSDLKESNKARFEEQVWLQALEQLPSFAKIHIGLFPSQLPAASLRAHGFQVLARQTFVVDLLQDEASLLAACKESTKRHIQAGQKQLLLQEAPQDALLLWKHYATTLQEKNTTILGSASALAKIVAQSIALHIGALYKVVDEQGVAHAWAWVVWDEQRAYYLMGARSSEAPHASALTYLLWQMMLLQKSKGKMSFDLEGSMDQGVANYYQGFPAQKTMYVAAQKNSHWLWKLRALFQ